MAGRRCVRRCVPLTIVVLAAVLSGCYTVPDVSRWEETDPTVEEPREPPETPESPEFPNPPESPESPEPTEAPEARDSGHGYTPPPAQTRQQGWPEGFYSGRFVVTYGFGTRSRSIEQGAVNFLFQDGRYEASARGSLSAAGGRGYLRRRRFVPGSYERRVAPHRVVAMVAKFLRRLGVGAGQATPDSTRRGSASASRN